MGNKLNFLVMIALVLSILFWFNLPSPKVTSNSSFQVTASFYPLGYFAQRIVGDAGNVVVLTPAGVEPHDYELSIADLRNIEDSSVLILNGAGLEPWGEKYTENLRNKDISIVIASEGLARINGFEQDMRKQDPHVWLDPVLAQKEAEKILDAVVFKNPDKSEIYKSRASSLFQELGVLDREYQSALSQCGKDTIVTSHSAFAYLASRYGLKQVSISGLSPDEEPSAQTIATITNFVKDTGIKYIFFEELVSPKLAETLARETNTQTLSFDPLEGLSVESQKKGEDYFTVMRKNLSHLKIALECK